MCKFIKESSFLFLEFQQNHMTNNRLFFADTFKSIVLLVLQTIFANPFA